VTSDSNLGTRVLVFGALLAAFLAPVGCGKKGEPSPPLPRGPNAIKDLAVEQEGSDALLSFTYPDRLLTGQPLTDLEAVEIYRLPGATPSMAAPHTAVSSSSSSGQTSTDRVPGGAGRRAAVSARMAEDAFYREAARVGRLTIAEIARRTRGATILYRDPLFEPERLRSLRLLPTEYLYYYYDFSQAFGPIGLPQQMARNSVRAGLTLWLPLTGR